MIRSHINSTFAIYVHLYYRVGLNFSVWGDSIKGWGQPECRLKALLYVPALSVDKQLNLLEHQGPNSISKSKTLWGVCRFFASALLVPQITMTHL